MLCNRTHSIRNYEPLEQPHSSPGKMPAADMCFTFLGSGQSLQGWLNGIHYSQSANTAAGAPWGKRLCCVRQEPAVCLGPLTSAVRAPWVPPAHILPQPCSLGGTNFFPAAPMLSALPGTSIRNLGGLFSPNSLSSREAAQQLCIQVATELSEEERHASMAVFFVLLGWSNVYHTLGTVLPVS